MKQRENKKGGKGRYILRQKKHHIKNTSLSHANSNRCIYLPHMAAYLIFDCLCQFVKVTGLAGGFSHSIITAINVMHVLRRFKNGFCDCALLIKGIWPSSGYRKHPCVCCAFHRIVTGASLALCHSSSDINHST